MNTYFRKIFYIILVICCFYTNNNLVEANTEKGIPYINPKWEEYMKLSDEEKEKYNIVPEKYIVDYVDDSVTPFSTYGALTQSTPTSFNLRNEYATDVYNQSSAGLCWAYATTTTIESNLLVNGVNGNKVDTNISVKQMDYLTYYQTPESSTYTIQKNPYRVYVDFGSSGVWYRELNDGWLSMMSYFPYLATGITPVTVDKFNEGYSTKITNDNPTYNSTLPNSRIVNNDNVEYKVTEYVDFPTYDGSTSIINKMKEHIMNYGALYIDSIAPDYRSGDCYDDDDYMIVENDEVCPDEASSLRHAMVIIGWDDNYGDADNDGVTEGAWILQNSWGSSIPSYEVYPYLSYTSEINHIHGIKTIETKTYDNHYDFTTEPTVYTAGTLFDEGADAVYQYITKYQLDTVFNRNTIYKEKLHSINFESEVQNGYFDIYISKTGNREDLVYYETVTSELPGLITVDFDEDIILEEDKFIVTVLPETTSDYLSLAVNAFTTTIDEPTEITVKTSEDISYQKPYDVLAAGGYYEYDFTTYTSNIPDGSTLTYKIYDSNNNLVTQSTNGLYIYTREVFNNNQPAKLVLNLSTTTDVYRIDLVYDGTVLDSFNFNYYSDIVGGGTQSNPYIITTASQLNNIRTGLTSYYKLNSDIDLTEATQNINGEFYNAGAGWEPIDGFTGYLYGNGYTIKGLYINRSSTDYIGLFNKTNPAYFENITFENPNITGKNYVGVLTGYQGQKSTSITNINVINGTVSGSQYVGGITGYTTTSIIKSSVIGNISGTYYVGGLIGYTGIVSTFENLYHNGNVTGTKLVGGIIGDLYELSAVDNIYNVGDVNATSTTYYYSIGGLIGNANKSAITNSYYIGNINNLTTYGAIAGVKTKSTSSTITLNNCYYNSNTTTPVISITEGYGSLTSTNVATKTLDELKLVDTYSGFDFSNTWEMKNDNVYPTLISNEYYYVSDINAENIIVDINETKKIEYNILPSEAYNKEVTFISNDETIVTIEDDVLTPKKLGETTIKITSSDITNISKEIKVYVVNKDIEIDEEYITSSDTLYNNLDNEITFNITSNGINKDNIVYKIYDSNNIDVTEKFITNIISLNEEEIKTEISLNLKIPSNISAGKYKIRAIGEDTYESNAVEFEIKEYIEVTELILNKTYLELIKGETEKLTVEVNPSNATNQNITWTISDTNIATVDTEGLIKALLPGTTTLTVSTENSSIKTTATIKVLDPSITIGTTSYSNDVNEDNKIYSGYKGEVSTNITTTDIEDSKEIIIEIKNSKEESVTNNFTISGNTINNNAANLIISVPENIEVDTYTVSVTINNLNKTYEFKVEEPILITNIAADDIEIDVSKTILISKTITPSNALNKKVTYTSNNTNIATVDSSGLVTGISSGETTISIKSTDGSNIEKIINVKVNGDKIVLKDESSYEINEEETLNLIQNIKLERENNQIQKVSTSTFISEFSVFNAEIKNKYGDLLSDSDYITTGTQVVVGDKIYKLVIRGDVDGDGTVTTSDAYSTVLHILGRKTLVDEYLESAEIDNDEKITTADAYKMVLFIIGKSESL